MKYPIIEIALSDKDYPKILSKIYDPPKILYCRGNISFLNTNCLAVVETRKITANGQEATQKIVSGLSDSGFTIVSGLALGIDAVAHKTALDYDLPTIAVLGSTVDDNGIGPRTNLSLAKEILENDGLLISEYRSSTDIFKANFAIRDRIISGLSKGVVVIEGADKSGSLITAKSAADQGRDVFAVPGSIFSATSFGPNQLIQNGAKPVTSAQDIIEEYGKNMRMDLPVKKEISTKDPIQQKILAILDEQGESTPDEIIRKSGLAAPQVMAAISMLEIKNKIKQRSGKYNLCN